MRNPAKVIHAKIHLIDRQINLRFFHIVLITNILIEILVVKGPEHASANVEIILVVHK